MIATADTDADGKISWLEFLTMMNPQAAAAQVAAEEAAAAEKAAEEAAAAAAEESAEKVAAEEAAAAAKKTADAIAAASQAFNEFDTDGSGVISASDLRNFNSKQGFSEISEENIFEMITVADAGADCADCAVAVLPGCLIMLPTS